MLQLSHRDSSFSSHCCTLGEVMDLSVVEAISSAAGGIASVAPTHRQCTIDIENDCSDYRLMNPRIHTYSGSCENPLPATIGVSKSGSALFIKTANTACGAVGVFTYDLYSISTNQNRGKMAVMFSNPYDFNMHSNWFAVGVFDMNKQCDHDLYNEMYYNDEEEFVRGKAKDGCLTFTSHGVTIRATMSDSYQPVIKVQVSND